MLSTALTASHLVVRDGGGRFAANIPVEWGVQKSSRWFKPGGNAKTQGVMGILSLLRGGCFRSLSEFERSEEECYGNCYANDSVYSRMTKGFNICRNGINGAPGFHVSTPLNWELKKKGYPKIWRCDSESSTSCLSLAIGFTQRWAQANPDKWFVGISSDYFHVPDIMLEWAARLRNIVVGHTISSWFSPDETRSRVAQALRWQELGVKTTLWVVTSPNDPHPHGDAEVKDALTKFLPEQVIEWIPCIYSQE